MGGGSAVLRSVLVGGLIFGLSAASVLLGGGKPLVLAALGLLVVCWVMEAPIVGVWFTVITQVIWLIGNYAPGGVSLLSPSKLASLLTLMGWALWAMRHRVAVTYAPHMVPLGGFCLLVLLGPVLTPAFEDSIVGVGKYAMMALPYFLVANLAVTPRWVLWSAMAISATATLSAILAITEFLLPGIELQFEGVSFGAHTDALSIDGATIKRVTGGIGDANWFSYTMATALPLCVFWFRLYPTFWPRLISLGMAGLQLLGLVLSYTRTPLVGLVGAVAFLVWKRRIPLMPLVVAATLGAMTSPLWLPDGFLDRFFSVKYIKEGSTPMRREIYEMAVVLIKERPVLGHGYQQYGPQFIQHSRTEMGLEWERRDITGEEPAHLLRAHNLYLDIWVMHGLLGLLLILAFYMALMREMAQVSAHGRPWEQDLAVCIMASLVAFFLCGLGGHSQELKIFWVLAGLAAGLRRVACQP